MTNAIKSIWYVSKNRAKDLIVIDCFFLFDYLSIIKRRQYCAPMFFWNHPEILKIFYQNQFGSCLDISFSESLEKTGKILLGLYLSLRFLEASLEAGVTFANLKLAGNCDAEIISSLSSRLSSSKKLFDFMQNFDRNISALNCFLNAQLSCTFKYSIFINN